MVFLKYLCLCGIIAITTYLGNLKSKEFINRVKELNNFQNGLVMFKSKIEFTYEPIKNIFEEISKVIYKNDENVFINTIKNEKDLSFSWCEAVNKENNFNEEDKEIIKMFGKLLGKTDLKGQVNEICLSMNLVQKQIEKAEKEKNKNVKMYKTMGIVCGLGICIILI